MARLLERLESIVFSRVKAQFSQRLKSTYPDLNFTTSSRTDGASKFPCVYIHMLGSVETGQDLIGVDVAAVIVTFQIEVIDSKSQARATEVMNEVWRIMKGMAFSTTVTPHSENTDSTYRNIARFRRIIADGDVL